MNDSNFAKITVAKRLEKNLCLECLKNSFDIFDLIAHAYDSNEVGRHNVYELVVQELYAQ